MITANEAKNLVNEATGLAQVERAEKHICKGIKEAAMRGENTYTYTTGYKTKASQIVKDLKELGYTTRLVYIPRAKREHEIVINW